MSSSPPNPSLKLGVSRNQEHYLLAKRSTEASYPVAFSYAICGRVDPDRFQAAIDAAVARHGVLRATFQSEDEDYAAQFEKFADVRLFRETAIGASLAEMRDRTIRYLETEVRQYVPTELVKAHLISTGPENHVLTLSMHRAVGDAALLDMFAAELFRVYAGGPPLPAAAGHYSLIGIRDDTGSWDSADQAYWHDLLSRIANVAILRPDLNAPRAGHDEVVFDLDYEEVETIASRNDASPLAVILSIANLVLARFTGSDDVQLTFQSDGDRRVRGSDTPFGPFSSAVVLRTLLGSEDTFEALAARQQSVIADALAHDRYPYDRLAQETGIRPNFRVDWFQSRVPPTAGGLKVCERRLVFRNDGYQLNIRFQRDGARLRLIVEYDATQFSRERIVEVVAAIHDAVRAILKDSRLPVSKVLPVPPELTIPALPPGDGSRIFDAFLTQAAAAPGRVALTGAGQRLTYGDLETRSAALARRLVVAGFGPGSRVAVLAVRGPRLVWTMLAVLRIGAIYIPLDSDYPGERLKALVDVARPDGLLLPSPGGHPDWAANVASIHFVDDDRCAPVPAEVVPAARLQAGDPDQPAYMLFTSGSTGAPKCIATSHRPVLNFLAWQRRTFGLTAEDRFTNLCGLAHDPTMRDMLAPLSIGAQLAIPEQDDIFKPGRLFEWFLEQSPTVTHLTPAMAELLSISQDEGQQLPLRLAFFGGDRLLPDVVHKMRKLASGAEMVNFYGTTETPQAAACHRCDPDVEWQSYPIGRGIDNFNLRIVDEEHRPVPDGAPGEIAVLSPFLSLGYVSEGNIQPHAESGIYYTGDTGFVLPSGDILFTGRRDDQISIRGYRVELEEINAALRNFGGVREAQALVENEASPRLVAFAVGDSLVEDELYAWLNAKLPSYMVPSAIVWLDKLPLLPNGKLDRKTLLALPRPARERLASDAAPASPIEQQIAAAWRDFLNVDESDVDQSFAQLHGDSLAYVQVFLATEALVGSLPNDWQTMTIREIAGLADRIEGTSRWFKWIDSAMLVRAIAIAMVVVYHLRVYRYGGGATTGLLMVSGYVIGRLQLKQIVAERSVLPLMKLLQRVLVPTLLYTTLYSVLKVLMGRPISPAVYLLYSDFVDYRLDANSGMNGYVIHLWYICAFLHMLLTMAALAWLMIRYWNNNFTAAGLAFVLFLIGLPLEFVLPGLYHSQIFAHGIEYRSAEAYWPTTHFATLALGMCVSNAETRREKLMFTLIILGYSAATFLYIPSNGYLVVLLSGLMLLYVRRLPIPKLLLKPVLFLSGSSLFIYLAHFQIAKVIEVTGLPLRSPLMVISVLVVGIGIWLAWQRVAKLLRDQSLIFPWRPTQERAAEAI